MFLFGHASWGRREPDTGVDLAYAVGRCWCADKSPPVWCVCIAASTASRTPLQTANDKVCCVYAVRSIRTPYSVPRTDWGLAETVGTVGRQTADGKDMPRTSWKGVVSNLSTLVSGWPTTPYSHDRVDVEHCGCGDVIELMKLNLGCELGDLIRKTQRD